LILAITFSGCSKETNVTNDSISGIQAQSSVEYSEAKVEVIPFEGISPCTRVEIGWAFIYVRYNGRYYKIDLDKVVKKGKVGKQIGKVERTISSSMVLSNEEFIEKDGDSNYLPEGSFIYAFKGKTDDEAIIVVDNGVFKEAIPYSN
jgi:hypothetical protein